MIVPGIYICAFIIGLIFQIGAAQKDCYFQENPTQVAVHRRYPPGSHHPRRNDICGGTIIGVKHVLTSSFCLENLGKNGHAAGELFVVFGCTYVKKYCGISLKVVEVWMRKEYFNFEEWTDLRIADTVAVLKLEKEIVHPCLKLAKLINKSVPKYGQFFTFSGWGIGLNTSDDRPLERFDVQIINNTERQQLRDAANIKLGKNEALTSLSISEFCAKPSADNWNCEHGIGGGLIDDDGVIHGIHSSCAPDNETIVFTSLDRFYRWIQAILKRKDFKDPRKYEDSHFHY